MAPGATKLGGARGGERRERNGDEERRETVTRERR
jgi:hypothetical protein